MNQVLLLTSVNFYFYPRLNKIYFDRQQNYFVDKNIFFNGTNKNLGTKIKTILFRPVFWTKTRNRNIVPHFGTKIKTMGRRLKVFGMIPSPLYSKTDSRQYTLVTVDIV